MKDAQKIFLDEYIKSQSMHTVWWHLGQACICTSKGAHIGDKLGIILFSVTQKSNDMG